MALTRGIKDTVRARTARDPAFRDALAAEAVTLDDANVQRLITLWLDGEASGEPQSLNLAELRRAAREQLPPVTKADD